MAFLSHLMLPNSCLDLDEHLKCLFALVARKSDPGLWLRLSRWSAISSTSFGEYAGGDDNLRYLSRLCGVRMTSSDEAADTLCATRVSGC